MGAIPRHKTVNLNQFLNYRHSEFFQSTEEELVVRGGAGAGKSYTAADKMLLQPIWQRRKIKGIVVRKSMPSMKRTCIPLIQERARLFGIKYELNRADMCMRLPFDSEIWFLSINHIDEIEKIKSITDCDIAWVEEANELMEAAIDQILLRLRGGSGLFKQLMMTFNPIGTTTYLYDRYFVRNVKAHKIKYTVYDNPYADDKYIRKLEALKHTNPNLYSVYCLGEWGKIEGTIYSGWQTVDAPPENPDEVIYGLDFGYNNPSALVKIYIKDQVPYLEEKIYQTNLTNQDLIEVLKRQEIGKDIIYADTAEPQRITELRRAGFTVADAEKSVNDGIDFVQSLPVHVIAGSENLMKEYQSYCWEYDRAGNYIDRPVKFMDHLLDAGRYALYTHMKHRFKFTAIGADGEITAQKAKDQSIGALMNEMMLRGKYGL